MARAGARLLLFAAALWGGMLGRAAAQEAVPEPANPWDLIAPTVDISTAPPPAAASEDRNDDLLVGDPFLDPPHFPPTAWFSELEIGIISPFYKNHLNANVFVPGVGTQFVAVPNATFPWTASPRFTVGYRFTQGGGEILATYRGIFDQASDTQFNFTVPGLAGVTSRLNINVIDLDYRSREYSLGPQWDLRWIAGARIITQYFDTREQGVTEERRISSNEYSAGPHIGLELWRWLGTPGHGLALYGKSDASFTFGRVSQNFEDVFLANGVPITGGSLKLTGDPLAVPGNAGPQYLPIFRVQVGATWVPVWGHERWRFTGGYEFEGWWWVGRLPGPEGANVSTGSTATLTTNGISLRAEWKY
jgi:hypothetical protein